MTADLVYRELKFPRDPPPRYDPPVEVLEPPGVIYGGSCKERGWGVVKNVVHNREIKV